MALLPYKAGKELSFSADRIIPDQSGGNRPAPGAGSSWSSATLNPALHEALPNLPSPCWPPQLKVRGLRGMKMLLSGDGSGNQLTEVELCVLGFPLATSVRFENMDSFLRALVSLSKKRKRNKHLTCPP